MSIHSRQKRKQWGCNPTSDCQKMTSIHAAAFSEYSVKPTTHTRPCHPQRQSGCVAKRCSSWTCWSPVPRPRPGGSDISRSASCSRALWSKQNDISLRHVNLSDSRLGKTIQKSTVAYSLYIFDNSPRSEIMMKLQHLQTNKIYFCHRMSRTWHEYMPLHSTETTAHQALAPSSPMSLYCKLMSVDGLVDFKCLGQGLEAATDQGWRLDFKRPTDKTLDLKSSDQRTFNLTKTCKSLWLNPCKNNPEINSGLQHLHIWQLALNRDEWRNYSTSKPSKLVTVTGCQESMGKWHHDMPQHSAEPSHTPGLEALVANPVPFQIDLCDGRVYLQRLGQGLETETDQGWRLHPGLYRSKRDHWNPENTWHLTLTCESLWYRT